MSRESDDECSRPNKPDARPVETEDLVALQKRLFSEMESRMTEKLEALVSAKDSNEESTSEETNPLVWNINAMSVLSWKGWDWPHNQRWDGSRQTFEKLPRARSGSSKRSPFQHLAETYILRYFLCCFPLVLTFLEVTILAGMTDQGSSMKRIIYGDGYYQSPLWRYSSTAASRDAFKPVYASNGAYQGLTANILKNRPISEALRCVNDSQLVSFNLYQWSDDPRDIETKFLPLVQTFETASSWFFTHCLAWEYAKMCAGVMKAQEILQKTGNTGTRMEWNPPECSLPDPNNHDPLMTVGDWESLSVSADEISTSYTAALLPKQIEAHAELAMWVTTRNVCDAKTLSYADDTISYFLYSNVSYLYRLGIGEAYLVELITIATLSFFLFFTSFLGEAQQLMYQISLCSTLRCYEDRVWSWTKWEGCGPSSQALRRKAEQKLSQSWAALASHYLALVLSDFLCDVFLSVRVLFLAFMVMCTEMITTWDRGVLAVIFSVLAIAFLFEIDDRLMEMFKTAGWAESAFYRGKLQPMLRNIIEEEERDLARVLAATPSDRAMGAGPWEWALRGVRHSGLWGGKALRFWAFLLTAGLYVVHQRMVFIIATRTGTQKDIVDQYDAIFLEWGSDEIGGGYQIAGLSGGIFAAVLGNMLCVHGVSCLANVVQVGLCLVWTYCVFRETVVGGLLAWYGDLRHDKSVTAHVAHYLLVGNGALLFPPLALHCAGCLLRPLVFYLRVRASAGKGRGLAGAGKGSGSSLREELAFESV